jgi:hypothetical protein
MPPRKPNYQFERMERDRLKANKNAMKASAKREERERARAAANPDQTDNAPDGEES